MLITIDELRSKFGVRLTEVMHLGAHAAEEAAAYAEAGARRVIWIEGNPELMPGLQSALVSFPGQVAFNVLVSDVDGVEMDLFVANSTQSSSLLQLGSHSHDYPGIHVQKVLRLTARRLDCFLDDNGIDTSAVTFLNIDLQGVELAALRSLGRRLDSIQYIYTEVNTGEVYKGCTLIGALDRFLLEHGFKRRDIRMTDAQWGDAFYERTNITWRDFVASHASVFWLTIGQHLRRFRQGLGWLKRGLRRFIGGVPPVNQRSQS